MKKISIIFIALILSINSFAKETNTLKKHFEKQKIKYSSFATNKSQPNSTLDNKKLLCIKSSKKIDVYQDRNKKYKSYEKRKKFLTQFFKKIFNSVEMTQVQSFDENVLRLKLKHIKDSYKIEKVSYRLGNFWSKTKLVNTYNENGETLVDIDITNISYGEYKGYFKFLASKVNKKYKKRKQDNYKSFYGYGSFNKVEQLKAFAKFNIEHDQTRGFLTIDATESSSEAGNIVEYSYKIFKENILESSFSTQSTESLLIFKEPGVFEIELTIEDEQGLFATSERQTITITDAVPNAKFKITENTDFPGHFNIDASESTDFEGALAGFQAIIFTYSDENGYEEFGRIFSESPLFGISIPEANKDFSVKVRAFDQGYQYGESSDSISIRYDGLGIAPKFEGYYISQDEHFKNVLYIGASFIDNGSLVEFPYKVTHEDGEVLELRDDKSIQDNGVTLTKTGIWKFEFKAIDDEGLSSDTVIIEQDIQWTTEDLIPIYSNHSFNESDNDPRVFYFNIHFHDELGEVVNYDYTITHDDGDSITPIIHNDGADELRLTKKGNWNFKVVATDNDGNKSLPFEFTQNIDWGDFVPTASMTIAVSQAAPNEVNVLSIDSNPRDDIQHFITATHTDGTTQEYSYNSDFFNFLLPNKEGVWEIRYSIVDYLGIRSEDQVLTFEVKVNEIDGDFIPPMPDVELNNSTLLGIDSDNDGVRDDVELWINDNTSTVGVRRALKQLAKYGQKILVNIDNENLIKEFSKKNQEAVSCLIHQIVGGHEGEEALRQMSKVSVLIKKLNSISYNTLARIQKELESRKHSVYVPNTQDRSQFCE